MEEAFAGSNIWHQHLLHLGLPFTSCCSQLSEL